MKHLTEHVLRERIFTVTGQEFEELALEIFRFQYGQNPFYREYCETIKVSADQVQQLKHVPYLPIQFFRTREIKTTSFTPELIFESSGTTGSVSSRHLVKDAGLYQESFTRNFQSVYGKVEKYCVIGLLPSYLERNNSSLVYMVNQLIEASRHADSGFYLYEHEKLRDTLLKQESKGQPVILIGVTYALLDFFERFPLQLKHTIIMETGGMKGRKEELTRSTVHEILAGNSAVPGIHSEYGMTELLSQAYARKDGLFHCPGWMKVLVRREDDPFEVTFPENTGIKPEPGVINIIDLANLYSCSFIATDDIGRIYRDGSFEVLGRLDNSDIRGCSLMVL